MIALKIHDTNLLLNRMLKGDLFDRFLLKEATIIQGFETTIDGSLHAQYYTLEEQEQLLPADGKYIPFALVRPLSLELLKGNRKPGFFRFVFLLSPKNQENTILHCHSSFSSADITGMFLHLQYKNDQMTCTTGISYNIFSPDKTLEHEWDRLAILFFKQHNIAVSEL